MLTTRAHFALTAVLCLSLSCRDAAREQDGPPPVVSSTALSSLRAIPLQTQIGTARMSLDASVWLDLMPIVDTLAAKAPLYAVITLRSHGAPLPQDVVADTVWLILRDSVWVDTLTGEPIPVGLAKDKAPTIVWKVTRTDSTAIFRLWGGPWSALHADSAEVVVRLRNGTGPQGYLRSPPVPIPRDS